ncbi:hypothetical protein KCTCHS21_31860 [Cohnella abietis]|uniref:Uncharacterized protein n=1 Tax=Cohnella abietis TaxID=2507935 RepID=A0A3T1D6T0_9BACL|nr:hypothetical protein KCTCHS21_31860 [Cohnella abietis]
MSLLSYKIFAQKKRKNKHMFLLKNAYKKTSVSAKLENTIKPIPAMKAENLWKYTQS